MCISCEQNKFPHFDPSIRSGLSCPLHIKKPYRALCFLCTAVPMLPAHPHPASLDGSSLGLLPSCHTYLHRAAVMTSADRDSVHLATLYLCPRRPLHLLFSSSFSFALPPSSPPKNSRHPLYKELCIMPNPALTFVFL